MMSLSRIVTVGGTVICALGVGFLMQRAANPVATVQEARAPATVATDAVSGTDGQHELTDITPTSAAAIPPSAPQPGALPNRPVKLVRLDNMPDLTDMPAEVSAPRFDCEPTLEAEPLAAAMVQLKLEAPCIMGERFTMHHNGMMFTSVTDEDGTASMNVPALARNAVFIVSFENGAGAVAEVEVTSLDYYDRVVLQWKGHAGLQIHAREYGADYGEDGHVWADSARDITAAALGKGGFMTRLGAPDVEGARRVEVYSFPSGLMARQGDVELSIEAEVTQSNCGRDIEAQSIQTSGNSRPSVRELVLAMPECDAVGDYLVLKNMLDDLKIAQK